SKAQNNFERLLYLMAYPLCDARFKQEWSLYLGFFQERLFNPSYHPDEQEKALENEDQDLYCLKNKTMDGWVPFGGIEKNPLFDLKAVTNIRRTQVSARILFLNAEIIPKESWNKFWSLYNLIQFFDVEQVESNIPGQKLNRLYPEGGQPASVIVPVEYDLSGLLACYDPEYHPLLRTLNQTGYLKSEADEPALSGLTDENGIVMAEAVLILHHKKIAIGPLTAADATVFREKNFAIVEPDQIQNITL
ncbi:MAG: hypothetical protein AB7V25_04070, partial [Mangrovibacterium sp.]